MKLSTLRPAPVPAHLADRGGRHGGADAGRGLGVARGGGGKQPEPAHRARARDGAARPDGQAVVRGYALREPGPPGEGINFRIQTDTGEKYTMELGPKPPREDRRQERRGERRGHGMQPPGGPPVAGPTAQWPSGCAALWACVDAGHHGRGRSPWAYPVIRRLTLRLEALQRSVKKFGDGDLSVRVPDTGRTKWPTWPGSSTRRPSGSKRW